MTVRMYRVMAEVCVEVTYYQDQQGDSPGQGTPRLVARDYYMQEEMSSPEEIGAALARTLRKVTGYAGDAPPVTPVGHTGQVLGRRRTARSYTGSTA